MKLRSVSWLCAALLLVSLALGGTHILPAAVEAAPPKTEKSAEPAEEADENEPGEGKPAEKDGKAAEKTAAEEGDKSVDDEEYFELLRLFADTLDQIDRNYVKDISRRQLMEAAIRGMLEELDQYSNYIPPKEVERFRTSVESEFGGIGIQVSIEEGWLTVLSPIVGSPAYKAGMAAGDQIVEIEGASSRGITLDEAVAKLKGKVGTKVTITVRHAGATETEKVTLDREIVRVDTVLGDRRYADDSWNFLYDEEHKLAYIRVTAFSRHTTEELQKAIAALTKSGMKGLVIDLRFNPGGLLSSAIEVCDLFIAEGKIVSTEGRNAPERVWNARKRGTFDGFPIAVLVNRYSASASEIVSACLQDHERAVVIGERTWGKGSVQNIIELEGGNSALKLTTAGYLRPNGKNIHKFDGAKEEDDWGVRPNEGYAIQLEDKELADLVRIRRERDFLKKPKPEAPSPEAPAPEAKDPEFVDRQLAKALDYLREKLAEKKTGDDDKPADKAEDANGKKDVRVGG